jgi:hypothetical protein
MKPPERPIVEALHILALFAFAVVQPLLDLLGRNPTFFIAHRADRGEILALISLLTLGIPSLLVLLEFAVGRFSRLWRRALHVTLLGLLFFLASLAALKRAGAALLGEAADGNFTSRFAADVAILVLALVASALFAVLYVRSARVRSLVTFLSPGVLVFPLTFAFLSPCRHLIAAPHRAESPVASVQRDSSRPLTPIVMVVFDELNGMSLLDRERKIDRWRYPNLARLADDATWFRNATTNDAWTIHAVPSLLTGNLPDQSRQPVLAEYPENMFTLLAGTHSLHVVECVTSLYKPMSQPFRARLHNMLQMSVDAAVVYARIVAPDATARMLPGIGGRWGNFLDLDARGSDATSRETGEPGTFREFVENIRDAGSPGLHYLHIMLPHVPYRHLPSGKSYAHQTDLERDLAGLKPHTKGELVAWSDDEWAALQAQQRYLLQLGFVDRLIGELVDHLQATGLYKSSLIVLASDHGVAFRPGASRRGLTKQNAAEILPILLMIKAPNQSQGIVEDRNVESIDVLPTVAALQGLSIPWTTDGQSAFDESMPPRGHKHAFSRDVHETLAGDFPERYASSDSLLRHFSDGRDAESLFRIGPNRELIGRRVAEFPLGDDPNRVVQVELTADTRFPDADALHCLVCGRIVRNSAVDAPPVELALAVGGTIRAITRTYRIAGRENDWSAMLPEEAVSQEPLDLEIFAVDSTGPTVKLSRARIE